jgi:probable F420-dependent oxidoreductase
VQIGVVLPQGEMGPDPGELREFVQGVEELGFRHALSFDHVLGADPAGHPGKEFHYTIAHPFHEPLVLFGFLAACAPRLEFATGILVLPQRQTALVAKQAAEVDVLSRGKLRLGVGVGWNSVEYESLGVDFRTRARRLEEQVELLRRLWQDEIVDFEGSFHEFRHVGLNPLPVQRPIPIWFGGFAEPARRRAARLGDGYIPPWPLPTRPLESKWPERLEEMRGWRVDAGRRDPMGIEPRLSATLRSGEEWRETAVGWRALGATHLSVQTTGLGMSGLAEHLDRLRLVREALADLFDE